ncbi:Zn(II)2Cys6 transcription factor-like protein [Penicillium cf. viridicatum]|uniref:Zn(II)2Cys6 transcription factor-like protein n=1 Tax=Penicillium cf. viridicatum TaxID=2972119 RepID=A0A9W9JI23_9EURO|nr:Zn(II)2Cys6 transcription factor-like protein [Penicillium cf. viridicatum]
MPASRLCAEEAFACDLCFARKVKCDRGNPCGGCLESKVRCLRSRPRRARKSGVAQKSNERIQSIIKRLSSLEDSLADVTSLAAASKSSPCSRGIPPANEASEPISSLSANSSTTLAHNKTGYSLCNDEASLHRTTRLHHTNGALPSDNDLSSLAIEGLDSTSLYPPCLEARSFLLDQLRDNGPSGTSQRIVLESALSFVERMPKRESVARGQTPQNPDTRASVASLFEEPPITVDLLYTMLNGNEYNLPGRAYLYEYTFCVRPLTLQKMALALLEKDGNEQTLLQYTVCVHCKAYCYIASLPLSTQSLQMQRHLRQKAQRHMDSAIAALDCLSLSLKPSLLFMQTLLAGGILFQYQGDTAKCWTLIAHASTICKALGWHDPTSFTFDPENEAESEIFAAVHQCYVLDKSISMKHNRPVSLPGLGYLSSLSETRFVEGPFSVVIKASLLHAQIQDKIIQQLQSNSHLSEADRFAIVTSLSEELSVFRSEYDQVRSQPGNAGDRYLHQQFIALDFTHYSLLTVICRYDPSINTAAESREKYLLYAREALLSVKWLRNRLEGSDQVSEFCSIFITWSMLMFPLSPYYIIFCNVVATSHWQDFQLLSDIVEILAGVPDVNSSICQLHNLCSMLVNLCKSLMNFRDGTKGVPQVLTQTPITNSDVSIGLNSFNTARSEIEAPGGHQPLPKFGQGMDWSSESCPTAPAPISGENITTWNEDFLWQLFNTQPSLECLERDTPPAMSDLT